MTEQVHHHWFPSAPADARPSHWWYWGRAVYISRRDYRRIFFGFLAIGVPMALLGFLLPNAILLRAAFVVAAIGLILLIYSFIGLYRMYGHPSMRYYARLLKEGGVAGKVDIADLHVGTYRTAFALTDLLPEATVHSIDCWNVEGPPPEEAVGDLRELEPRPTFHPRIVPGRANDFTLPLANASCDVVIFGFGTHEIPTGGPREKLFEEAKRILRSSGRVLIFEHGQDWHNFLIFGPIISHVTRREEWLATMRANFDDVKFSRSSAAVDLFSGQKRA